MRTCRAIVSGCVSMLVTFSVLWSFFVIRQHSYGDEDRTSQIFGTTVFFGIYLLPVSFVFALLLVWPTERFSRRLGHAGRLTFRGMAWLLVACASYVFSAARARGDLSVPASACGLVAALISTSVYSVLVPTLETRRESQM